MIPLLSADQIQARIVTLAQEIDCDYPSGEPLHFVAVLQGAFLFLADLTRAMTRPLTLDFIAVSSYPDGVKTTGEVRLLKDLDSTLADRNVIIVEDIVDTGLTLAYLQEIFRARAPRSLKTVCLLSRSSRRRVNVRVDYIGFEIGDSFVVGYGLDYGGQFRNLPYIAVYP